MIHDSHQIHRASVATAIIFMAATSLPQHLLLAASNLSPMMNLPSAEAFVLQRGAHHGIGTNAQSTISSIRRIVHTNSLEQSMNNGSYETARCTNAEETTTNNEEGNFQYNHPVLMKREESKTRGERIRILAKHAATLLLATFLSVEAPMPAMAEWEASMPSNDPFMVETSSFPSSQHPLRDSSLVLALEAPYTGQLVDTSGANLVRLNSGVTYNDLREGTGEGIAEEGKRVNIQWVLKRSNGYSIDSSAQNDGVPFIFVVGTAGSTEKGNNSRAIPGLDEGIRGMRVGGIRRIVIPPSLAYVGGLGDDSPGPIPPGFGPKQRIKRVMENRMDVPDESFLLDVKLTRVQ